MTKRRLRLPRKPLMAAAALSFLILGLDPATSVPSVPDTVPTAPDLQHVLAMEELADWVVGPGGDEFSLTELMPEDLTSLLRERPQTFELFQAYSDEEAAKDLLADIPFGTNIDRAAEKNDLDALLLAALVETESSFRPTVVSPAGAVGLTQVLPSTARWIGAGGNLKNPDSNLEAGARYLSRMLDQFDGDLEMALAAYNAGPNAVRRHGGVPPYTETQNYVDRVLTIYVDHHRGVWETTGLLGTAVAE